ncbi:hypothetical protein DACRYDRAFT_103668 [Dacryopinax primogenitus]|uniref:Uncharacterized protein n=1 Tax=Dacryopinax primogenitus (strain DJM 731) TaxID=1858805 RepID=M5GGB0_DACPD|nr:uncharacterized protein DACRYDRAFT_103668 [Dacryopinax primogenitus]EJU05173.1 hypothetical protein DACRYDRAFT_103668 [Dacryopinax primogenitus]
MYLAAPPEQTVLAVVGGADKVTRERVDALNLCLIRGALFESEGELWVAESERPDTEGGGEIIGMALWFRPGTPFMGSGRQRRAVRWEDFGLLLDKEQEHWYFSYYSPRIGQMWARSLAETGHTVKDSYYLRCLYVRPDWHNHGVAGKLTSPVLLRALRQGKRLLGTATRAENVEKYLHVGCKLLGSEEFVPRPETGIQPWTLYALEFLSQSSENSHWKEMREELVGRPLAKL